MINSNRSFPVAILFGFSVSGLVSCNEWSEKVEHKPKTVVHFLSLMNPVPFIKQYLQLTAKGKVWEVIRTREMDLTISFAKKEIAVEDFQNVVVIKSYVYLEETCLFQYTELRHRPDKFRFVDFARRARKKSAARF